MSDLNETVLTTDETVEALTGNPLMDDPTLWGESVAENGEVFPSKEETEATETTENDTPAEAAESSKAKASKAGKFVSVDPRTVRVNHELLGRHFARTEQDIQEKVDSFMRVGQLQPVRVKALSAKEKTESGFEYELIFGGTRHEAALRIPGFQLKVEIVKGVNKEDAFLMMLDENERRNETNPIDDSYNIWRLRDLFKWDTPKIQGFYKWSASKLSIISRLKELDAPIQKRVANGLLDPADAVKLLKMNETDVAELLATVPEELPRPTVEELTIDTFPANGESELTGHPLEPVKPKRGRPAKLETQEERNRKALKAYESSKKATKKALAEGIKTRVKTSGGNAGQRTLQELKAVLNDRDDDVSSAIKQFIANELNAADLDAELDRIKDALNAYEKSKRQN